MSLSLLAWLCPHYLLDRGEQARRPDHPAWLPFDPDTDDYDSDDYAEREERRSRGTSRVASVKPGDVVTTSQRFLRLDLCTCTEADLSFTADFDLTCPSRHRPVACSGLALWFDCVFPAPAPAAGSNEPPREIVLTTSPTAPKTHWHQTMIHFGADALAQGEAMETDEKAAAAGQAAFDCTVELKVDPAAPRSYRISVNC